MRREIRVCVTDSSHMIQAGEFVVAGRGQIIRDAHQPHTTHPHTFANMSRESSARAPTEDFVFEEDVAVEEKPQRTKPNWSKQEESKIQRIFKQCDTDDSGTVSLTELFDGLAKDKNLARTLGIPAGATAADSAELAEIFKGLDTDGNAELDFEEFGYFFAERVEVLRYLPLDGADEQYVSLEETMTVLEGKGDELSAAFEEKAADLAAVEGLRGALQDALPAVVGKFLEPSELIPEGKRIGKEFAKKGADAATFAAYNAALVKAIESLVEEWTVAYGDAWSAAMKNFDDMLKLGVEQYSREESEAAEAAKIKAAEEKAAAEAEKKAAEEAAKAAAEAAKKAEQEAKKAAEEAAKAVKEAEKKKEEEEAQKKAEEAAKAAKEAEEKKAAEEAKKAEEQAKAKAAEEAAKAAAEAAKKAEEEAKAKAAEVAAAEKKRKEEQEKLALEREKSIAQKAKDDAKKSEEEKAAEEAKKAEAKAAAEAAKAKRAAAEEQARVEAEKELQVAENTTVCFGIKLPFKLPF